MARPDFAGICCLIVLGSSGAVRAQELPLPSRGSRVRITWTALESPSVVGTLAAIDPESMTVVPASGGDPRVVARSEVLRLERSVEPSRKGRGALIGLGLGLAVAVGKVVIQGGCNDGCDSSNVLVGAAVAVSGATLGAIAAPGERWEDVPVERVPAPASTSRENRLHLHLVPQVGRRIGLTLVASF
jgi:hypothetical protein